MTENNDLHSLEKLSEDLEKAKHIQAEREGKPSKKEDENGIAAAMRVSVELVAGVGVGGILGYGLDKWLDTAPVFLLICFILGVAGSMMNIYRYLQK